jgi:dTDP-4-dehydrorhamnose reductase
VSGTRGRLVTGAGGMLVQGLPARLATARIPALAVARAPADITDSAAVREVLTGHRAAAVVDRTAGTAADTAGACEDDAPRHPAGARREPAAVLPHVSTDHGLPGVAEKPYAQDAPTGPRRAYGRTGPAGGDFVRTMIKPKAVKDALGGVTTWSGFTREASRLPGADPKQVRPATSAAFARPAYGAPRHSRWQQAGIEPIRDRSEALSSARPVLVAESQEGNP